MATNATQYVVPGGWNLVSNIMGGDITQYRNAPTSMFQTYDAQGNPDPRGQMAAPTDAWNFLRLGYGTAAAPDVLNAAAQEAQNRYLGDPTTGAGGWNARWNAWNASDPITDPTTGQTYYSPVQLTGERMNQGFGGRDANGNPINPIQSNTNQGFTYLQHQLAANPDLNTGNIMSGYNSAMQGSPFSAPGLADYMSAIQPANGVGAIANMTNNGVQAVGGLGQKANFDQYGLRGIDQTNALDTANLNQLTGAIDTSAQQTLANQLPAVQQAMEAAGLGRSGAGQQALLQSQNEILSQANRDKQNVLAQFINNNADRGAQAINLATQQGYGGAGQTFGANIGAVNAATQLGAQAQNQWDALQGGAAMGALQGQQQFNTIGQQGASNLYGQTMANANQRYLGDTGNYLQSLLNSQSLINQQNQMQANGQSQALADWLGLQSNRDQSQANSMNQALTTADAQRQIQQDRINQMMQASFMPFQSQMTIATGTTPMSAPQGQPSFWQRSAPGITAAAGQAVLGNGQQNSGLISNLWNG